MTLETSHDLYFTLIVKQNTVKIFDLRDNTARLFGFYLFYVLIRFRKQDEKIRQSK